jgi:serine/threonine protein kinase
MKEALQANTTLSHYRISSHLGDGGMGQGYLARDTKLDRDVALKILPETFARNVARVARFEREARAGLLRMNVAFSFSLLLLALATTLTQKRWASEMELT